MPGILNDNFETYSDGYLDNNGSPIPWLEVGVANDFYVQGDITYNGQKAVRVSNPAGDSEINREGESGVTEGNQGCFIRKSNTNTECGAFAIKEDLTLVCTIKMENDGHFKFIAAQTEDLGAYSADTWYWIEIEWRLNGSDEKVRARVNDGSWSSWLPPWEVWSTAPNVVNFQTKPGTADVYWDYLSYSSSYISSGSFFLLL
jgi:hypothetical protein